MSGLPTEVLAGERLLSGLPEGAVELVAGCAELASFDAGSLLLREGDPAETLHLIRSGRVSIEVHGAGQEPHLIDTIGPGHLVGLSWLAPPRRWMFDARALEPVRTVAIDAARLHSSLEANPEVGFALYERLLPDLLGRLQSTRLRLLDLYGHGRRL